MSRRLPRSLQIAFASVRQMEIAFGQPLETLVADFERQPVAAASVAQVHRARLQDGADVAVKVRRPGL